MGNHWGYTDPDDGHVTMKVPTDMAEEVSAFVANPEGFMDALARAGSSEEALGMVMIEVEPGTWVDPKRIAAIHRGALGLTSLMLDTGGYISLKATPDALIESITAKLSEAAGMLAAHEGEPPA